MSLKDWVRTGKEKGASDLMLEAGTPPVFRIRGELVPASEVVSSDQVLQMARSLLNAELWSEFLARRSADLSQTLAGVRCRINLFQTVRGVSLAVRLLSSYQTNLRDCNLNPELKKLIEPRSGLVLISGPTGSGKSTTLAALIGELNASVRRNIITLESPIEYFFANRMSYIRQREIPTHSPTFEQAIVDAMRENPDVLVIGEMRTPDVMRLTLNAAETGHLVLATVHSSSCAEALTRLCMSFAPEIQAGVRAQLADCIQGVVCQRLSYIPSLQLRVPHCEILHAASAAKSTIRTGQFSQIQTVLQAGGEEGNWTFDRYQKWIDGKKDWQKPSQAALLEDDVPHETAPLPRAAPPRSGSPSPVPTARALPKEPPSPSREGRIEIEVAEDDLAELAKRIQDEE